MGRLEVLGKDLFHVEPIALERRPYRARSISTQFVVACWGLKHELLVSTN